jgi:hypothetical protein
MKTIRNRNMKWWIGIMSCITLFAVIAVFSYEKMCFVWRGVEIEATIERKENSSLAEIRGKAEKANYIALNGREIFIDKEGNFSETISILPGFSVVTIDAKDKFGKQAEKKFEIVMEKDAKAIAFENSQIIN